MDDTNRTEAADIMALGSALSDPLSAKPPEPGSSTPFVVVPEGYEVHDLERLFPVPARARGEYTVNDVASFIALFNELKSANTRVYGMIGPVGGIPVFQAVLNDNGGQFAPGWRDHKITYACPLSKEWQIWTKNDGRQMKQADFAKFIEDNSVDIREPAPAAMIEISRTLEAKKKVNFASGVRLDNGQTQIVYEEEIQGTAAKGQLQIPQEFTVGVQVLEGGLHYAMVCRLRYRIDGGSLTMWYDLLRPHKIIEDAVKQVRDEIGAGTGQFVFNGTPG